MQMTAIALDTDSFGDRFTLSELSLPRQAHGYALQKLDTDQLFDQLTGNFLPIRTPALKALFPSFDSAHEAASAWVCKHCQNLDDHRIAIVPASFGGTLKRHVLIYGVLCSQP
jgi:hypothetical protein